MSEGHHRPKAWRLLFLLATPQQRDGPEVVDGLAMVKRPRYIGLLRLCSDGHKRSRVQYAAKPDNAEIMTIQNNACQFGRMINNHNTAPEAPKTADAIALRLGVLRIPS